MGLEVHGLNYIKYILRAVGLITLIKLLRISKNAQFLSQHHPHLTKYKVENLLSEVGGTL